MAVKSAVYDYSLYTPDYYLKGFLAGGVCCSVTLCRNQNSLRARRDALLHFHTGCDGHSAETKEPTACMG